METINKNGLQNIKIKILGAYLVENCYYKQTTMVIPFILIVLNCYQLELTLIC